MCLNTRFYSCILLNLLALSAIICNCLRSLDNCLVSSSSEGKIYGISRKFIILRISEAVHAQTYTDGHGHLISDVDCLDIFEKLEM